MSYAALIDEVTLSMTDKKTGEVLDAVAVVPGYTPDMACMVNMLSPDQARELEHMAALRARGMEIHPPAAL